jgi:hypothetical protein
MAENGSESAEKKHLFFSRIQYHAFARVARVTEQNIAGADSFRARDRILRKMAAEAYGLAKAFKDEDDKLSLQYMKLAAKLLGMSLRPKKLSDLEEIKKALAKLKERRDGLENSSG